MAPRKKTVPDPEALAAENAKLKHDMKVANALLEVTNKAWEDSADENRKLAEKVARLEKIASAAETALAEWRNSRVNTQRIHEAEKRVYEELIMKLAGKGQYFAPRPGNPTT